MRAAAAMRTTCGANIARTEAGRVGAAALDPQCLGSNRLRLAARWEQLTKRGTRNGERLAAPVSIIMCKTPLSVTAPV